MENSTLLTKIIAKIKRYSKRSPSFKSAHLHHLSLPFPQQQRPSIRRSSQFYPAISQSDEAKVTITTQEALGERESQIHSVSW